MITRAVQIEADLSKFSFEELIAAYANLGHVFFAASGCCNQPRSNRYDGELNRAGILLDQLANAASHLRTAVVDEIESRTPADDGERNIRDHVILVDTAYENDKLEDDLAHAIKRIGRKVVLS